MLGSLSVLCFPCSITPCGGHPRGSLSSGFLKLEREAVPHPTLQDISCQLSRRVTLLLQLGLVGFPQSSQCCSQYPSKEEPRKGTGTNWSPVSRAWRPLGLPGHRSVPQPGAGLQLTTCTISAFRSFSRRRFRFSSRRRFFSCGSSTKMFPVRPSLPPSGLKPKLALTRS